MVGNHNLFYDAFTAFDANFLLAHDCRKPLALVLIVPTVSSRGTQVFFIKILDIRKAIRISPGYVVVVSCYDQWHAWECDAGDLQLAAHQVI